MTRLKIFRKCFDYFTFHISKKEDRNENRIEKEDLDMIFEGLYSPELKKSTSEG